LYRRDVGTAGVFPCGLCMWWKKTSRHSPKI
jgi:hypothetical protein